MCSGPSSCSWLSGVAAFLGDREASVQGRARRFAAAAREHQRQSQRRLKMHLLASRRARHRRGRGSPAPTSDGIRSAGTSPGRPARRRRQARCRSRHRRWRRSTIPEPRAHCRDRQGAAPVPPRSTRSAIRPRSAPAIAGSRSRGARPSRRARRRRRRSRGRRRASCPAAGSASSRRRGRVATIDLATRLSMAPKTSAWSMVALVTTASAASSVKCPTNTASRRSTTRSRSDRSP